jgi:Zn-dependent protease
MLFLIGSLRDADIHLIIVIVTAFALALIAGLSFHEFSHALVGDLLGDRLPRAQGRLTLNPAHHLDSMGTLMLLFAPFGWAKPVSVNPRNLRGGPKVGMVLVALAGPISNFVLAGALAAPLKAGILPYRETLFFSQGRLFISDPSGWGPGNYLAALLFYTVLINITLGIFNLIPIPPLDGSRVAQLLPGAAGDFFIRMERDRWGFGILFLLIALPFLTGGQIDIIGAIVSPIQNHFMELFLNG